MTNSSPLRRAMDCRRRRRPIASALFAGLLAFWWSGAVHADTASTQSRTLLEQAREALSKNDLPTAVIRLKNAARIDPDNLEIRLELGRAALKTGDVLAAEKEFEKVLQGGSLPEAIAGYADALLRQGKFDAVLTKLRSNNADPSAEAAIRAKRASALLGLSRLDDAISEARSGIAAKETADGQATLARALQRKGDDQGSDKAIDAALRLQPDQPDALLIRGQLRASAKDLKTAEQLFDRVLAVREDSIEARLGRASARLDLGNQDGAIADLDAILKRQPKFAPAFYYKALAAVRRNDARGAQEFINQLAPAFIDSSRPAQLLAASVAFSNGQLASADSLATKAQIAVPDDPAARQLLGAIRLRGGKPLDAISLLEPLAAPAKIATIDPVALRQLADAYLTTGRNDDAVNLYQRAAASAPTNAVTATELAATQIRVGRTEDAVRQLEALIQRDPTQNASTLLLLNAYLRLASFEKARNLLPTIRKQLPDSPAPDYYSGLIAQQSGDVAGARTAFEGVVKRNPEFTQAAFALAALNTAALRPDAARQNLLDLLSRDPADERAMAELAAMAFNRGKRSEGVEWLQKAVTANPRSVPARLALINRLLSQGDAKVALTQAEDGMRQMPGVPEIADRYGAALLANDRKEDAATHYRAMIQRYPEAAVFQARLAEAQQSDDPKAAERSLRRAIELAPADVDMRLTLIRFLLAQKQPELAIDAARETQAAIPNPTVKPLLADLYRSIGRLDQLRNLLETDFARNQKDFMTALQLADLAYTQGAPEVGAGWLTKAIAADAQSVVPRLAQIDRMLSLRDHASAGAAIDAAAKQFPNNPDVDDRRGRLLVATGKPADAARIYAKLAESAPPGAATPQLRLAESLLAAGDPAGARKALERAVQITPRDISAYGRLASFLVNQNLPDAAIAVANKAVQEIAGAGSLGLLGETQLAVGRFDAAAKTFADIDAAAPNPQAMSQRVVALFSGKKEAEALAAAAEWSTRFPDDDVVPLVLADRLMQAGRLNDATPIYEKLLTKAPNDPRILNNLSWSLKDTDLKRATQLAEQAYQAQPTSTAIADTFAVLLSKSGDHKRAVDVARQAASSAPQEQSIQFRLAEALVGGGDKAAAIQVLRTITAANQAWRGKDDAVAMLRKLSSE